MFFKIFSFFWQLLTFSTPLTTLGKNVRYAAACWLTAIESCVCVSLKSKIMTLNEAHFLYSILHDTTQTQGGLMHVHSFCSAARMHEHGAVAHLLWVHANNVGLSPAFEAWAPVLSIGLSPPPTLFHPVLFLWLPYLLPAKQTPSLLLTISSLIPTGVALPLAAEAYLQRKKN